MRKPTPERLKELNDLADWCEFVLTAKYDLYEAVSSGQSKYLREDREQQLDILKKVRERIDLRGLRMVYRDYVEELNDLPPLYRDKIDRRLRERFGRGLNEAKGKIEKQVHAILARGVVRKADEYRILESWIEMTWDDPKKAADIERINVLLATITEPLPE